MLADAKLLPADANTAVVASFCIDHESAAAAAARVSLEVLNCL